MKTRNFLSWFLISAFVFVSGCSKPVQNISAGAIRFSMPAAWNYSGQDQEGRVQFTTDKDMRKALIGFLRLLKVGEQTPLEWAKDEAKSLTKDKTLKIIAEPSVQTIGKSSWIVLIWEKQVDVQGTQGLLRGIQFYLNQPERITVEVIIMGGRPRFTTIIRDEMYTLLNSVQIDTRLAENAKPAVQPIQPAKNTAANSLQNEQDASIAHLYLNTGEIVHGAIVKEDSGTYEVKEPDGFQRTIQKSEVKTIEGNQQAVTPLSSDGNKVRIFLAKEHGLSIEVPEGWSVIDKTQSGPLFEQVGGRTPGFIVVFSEKRSENSPFIYIGFNPLIKNYSLEEYVGVLREHNSTVKERIPGAECTENAVLVEINSRQVSKTTIRIGSEHNLYYHFLRGRIVYSVIGSISGDGKLNEYSTMVEQVVKNMSFDKQIHPSGFDLVDAGGLALWAAQYFQGRQYDEAIVFNEEALKKNPSDDLQVQILFSLSSAYLEKGLPVYLSTKDDSYYKKALAYAEQALALRPHEWKILGNVATLYMNMNQLQEADKYFKEAEKYADQKSPYYQQLILTHGTMMGIETARKDALNSQKPAVANSPTQPNIAYLYLNTGEIVHGAIVKENSGTYEVKEPDGFQRTIQKSEIIRMEGKQDVAASMPQAEAPGSVSKPVNPATRIENQGIQLLNQGKFEEGIKLMKQAISMDGKNGLRHMNLGGILFSNGAALHQKGEADQAKPLLDEAEQELQKAVECFLADPSQDKGNFGLAQSYYILGDIQYFVRNNKAKAEELYEKAVAVKSSPPHEGAARNLKELKFN